jgi:hypothetical protein
MSCSVLRWHLVIGKATCLRILHKDIGLVKCHLGWITHTFSAGQKSERVSYSRQLLAIVEQQQSMDFEYVITSDESWFYFDNPLDAAWAASRDELPERVKRKIDTGESQISVVWSVNGILYLIDVPQGCSITVRSVVMLFCRVQIRPLLPITVGRR